MCINLLLGLARIVKGSIVLFIYFTIGNHPLVAQIIVTGPGAGGGPGKTELADPCAIIAYQGSQAILPFCISNVAEVGAVRDFVLEFDYDIGLLEINDISTTETASEPLEFVTWDVLSVQKGIARVRVYGYSFGPATLDPEQPVLLHVVFQIRGTGSTIVDPVLASFNEGSVQGQLVKGEVTVAYSIPITAKILDDPAGVTEEPILLANYPNPFNPSTQISFHLFESAEISLEIYNAAGTRVRTLARGHRSTGRHSLRWDGQNQAGAKVPGGMYFVRLLVPGYVPYTRALSLIK